MTEYLLKEGSCVNIQFSPSPNALFRRGIASLTLAADWTAPQHQVISILCASSNGPRKETLGSLPDIWRVVHSWDTV